MWARGWPFWPRKKLDGFRIVATDVEWAVGEGRTLDGRTLEGPIEAILLLLNGRPVALRRLAVGGVEALQMRLAPTSR